MTGHLVAEISPQIEKRQEQLNSVVKHFWPGDFEKPATQPTGDTPTDRPGDLPALIQTALNSKDELFNQLWAGDPSLWAKDAKYPSQSEADQALCNKLSFWAAKDFAAIDALFRESGLYRAKWDRPDYSKSTIDNAIASTTETYRARANSAAEPQEGPPVEDPPPEQDPIQGEPELKKGKPAKARACKLKDLIKKFDKDVCYIWREHIPKGMPVMLAADAFDFSLFSDSKNLPACDIFLT